MEKDVIKDRLKKLRAWMTDENITFFVIPTADYHGSEYVSDYFKVREYFSGFTGSNGTLVIGHEMAGLWTDGRYFIHNPDIKRFKRQINLSISIQPNKKKFRTRAMAIRELLSEFKT